MHNILRAETRTWVGSGVGRQNEDYARIDEQMRHAVLVDGATGLTKANVVEGQSDAAWYARELTGAVLRQLSEDDSRPCEAMAQAASEVADAYLRIPGAAELERIDLPNASMGMLLVRPHKLDVVMLGDCTAAVLLNDGSVQVVHDGTLDVLDTQNYERMYVYACEHGVSMAQARKDLNDAFVANRLKMNEPGGYWAADISCRGFGHEICASFDISKLHAALVCSDGFAAALEMDVVSGWHELMRRVALGEGEELGEELRRAEQADAACWNHHRSKTSDDATYAAFVW